MLRKGPFWRAPLTSPWTRAGLMDDIRWLWLFRGLRSDIRRTREAATRARARTEQAKAETERIRAETERMRAETEIARIAADVAEARRDDFAGVIACWRACQAGAIDPTDLSDAQLALISELALYLDNRQMPGPELCRRLLAAARP